MHYEVKVGNTNFQPFWRESMCIPIKAICKNWVNFKIMVMVKVAFSMYNWTSTFLGLFRL